MAKRTKRGAGMRRVSSHQNVHDDNFCFLSFDKLHANNIRPFYVILMERSTNKGLPNNCTNIHNEKININFSRENLIMAKIFKCS